MIAVVLKAGVVAAAAGALFLFAGIWVGYSFSRTVSSGLQAESAIQSPPPTAPAVSAPTRSAPTREGFTTLESSVVQLLNSAGASGGVSLTELGGTSPQSWSYKGDDQMVAASTYKLPLLMEEAQNVSSGHWRGTDSLCYEDGDWEDGYYSDYDPGICLSRAQLDQRVGQTSDNTAAHILVRNVGGASALNNYARDHGARKSAFYDPNTTTTNDLARLWVNEATGHAGGRKAQQYLYPMLTHTVYEHGIPAGVPSRTNVVHKIGILGGVINDAGVVLNGPHGAYVLTICTQGQGGDAGWSLLASISRAVWQFEAAR